MGFFCRPAVIVAALSSPATLHGISRFAAARAASPATPSCRRREFVAAPDLVTRNLTAVEHVAQRYAGEPESLGETVDRVEEHFGDRGDRDLPRPDMNLSAI